MDRAVVPNAHGLVPMGNRPMTDVMMLDRVEDGAISFARGFVKSEAFMLLFREGMGLVERTAGYLDGDGRAESAKLPRDASLTYATESMRLTTRLMQIASWLLVQRAVAEGEMSAEQARAENNKVRLSDMAIARTSIDEALLPEGLRELIAHSLRLQERIRHLENQMSGAASAQDKPNPVQDQLASLQARLGIDLRR
jgi:regulator of CtrA degradation